MKNSESSQREIADQWQKNKKQIDIRFHLHHQLSWVSSLLAPTVDFDLASQHNCVAQFLIINSDPDSLDKSDNGPGDSVSTDSVSLDNSY